ncbi:E3 ubiquitin/ISG15 ligase TRIM25-like [Danio rerio]|uniref:E3 ubiquitin/ISG15 ligase TRIM25-like n=3 Tax=Danio rerio TaxID=7955 RepID=A0AC58G240_DANRE
MLTVGDVSRHLLCPVCKTLLEEPVSISCGHTFCKRCLDESLSESQCPLCQEPVSTKPSVNEAIEALLQEFRQTLPPNPDLFSGEIDAVPCDICEKDFTYKAIKSCLTCLLSYCDKHLKQHQSKARFKNHTLVNAVKDLDKRSCTEYGRALELYCRRNECCICALCVKTDDDVIPVKSERKIREAKHRNPIEEMKMKIKKREDKLKELKESAEKCQVSTVHLFACGEGAWPRAVGTD